jgi:hypothetical protein
MTTTSVTAMVVFFMLPVSYFLPFHFFSFRPVTEVDNPLGMVRGEF